MRASIKTIIKHLKDDSKGWKRDGYCLKNSSNNYEIWIGNGLFFYGVRRDWLSEEYNFSLLEKIRLHRHIKYRVGKTLDGLVGE